MIYLVKYAFEMPENRHEFRNLTNLYRIEENHRLHRPINEVSIHSEAIKIFFIGKKNISRIFFAYLFTLKLNEA